MQPNNESQSNAPGDDDDDDDEDGDNNEHDEHATHGSKPNLNIPTAAHQRMSPQPLSQHHSPAIASLTTCGQPQQMPINLKTNENNNKIKCEQSDAYHGLNASGYEDMDVSSVTCKVGKWNDRSIDTVVSHLYR